MVTGTKTLLRLLYVPVPVPVEGLRSVVGAYGLDSRQFWPSTALLTVEDSLLIGLWPLASPVKLSVQNEIASYARFPSPRPRPGKLLNGIASLYRQKPPDPVTTQTFGTPFDAFPFSHLPA